MSSRIKLQTFIYLEIKFPIPKNGSLRLIILNIIVRD